jgi:hypothetical protein
MTTSQQELKNDARRTPGFFALKAQHKIAQGNALGEASYRRIKP